MTSPSPSPEHAAWRKKIRVVIFEADTPAGKIFDVALLCVIVASIAAVMLDSVASIRTEHHDLLATFEWIFTIIFTVEYALRLVSVPVPTHYARSFFGVVDLLAILPTYLSLLIPGTEHLLVIRALRLLRIFRVFKLGRYLGEADILRRALLDSRHKITIFLGTITILVTILGTAMYLLEGEENGFTSIPLAVYWAVVTLTTVGYGDLAPQTVMGKALATVVMVLGYAIIAVPTGIVTAEIVGKAIGKKRISTKICPICTAEGHDWDAKFCNECGARLDVATQES